MLEILMIIYYINKMSRIVQGYIYDNEQQQLL